MGKQRQMAVLDDAGEGRGRRAVLVQEQEFRVLDARDGLALTEVETMYLVEELRARGVDRDPKDLHHALEGVYELAQCELPPGGILAGVKDELMRVAYEKEGSFKRAARKLGCGNSTIHVACNAVVKRGA